VPRALLPRRGPWELLAQARLGLQEAASAASAGERYATAHLAALRLAAAVLADRAAPSPSSARGPRGHSRPRSAWTLLARVAPELGEWAQTFAAGAALRAAAESGRAGAVTTRQADDLLRDVQEFSGIVVRLLGRPHQHHSRAPSPPSLPSSRSRPAPAGAA
jgi:hypothetical protein